MPTFRVVTDNASDLPPEVARRAGITIVPLDVRFAGRRAPEIGVMDPERFWQESPTSMSLTETSAPSPGAFAEAFASAKRDGCEGAVCVTISADLSSTYDAARAGAAAVVDFPVEVIDSRSATMGEGLLALEAAAQAEVARDLHALADHVRDAVPRLGVLGTLDSLDSLRRGGRIGAATALLGSVLSVKAVIEIRDGVVAAESRQRTRARSLSYLADKIAAAGSLTRIAVIHAQAHDLESFLELLAPVCNLDDAIITLMGPVIGAHTGPGTIGVCFLHA